MKKFITGLLFSLLAFLSFNASAVIDVTAVNTGISDAGTAIGSVIAALLALSVTIFGVVKVYNFVSRKAGA